MLDCDGPLVRRQLSINLKISTDHPVIFPLVSLPWNCCSPFISSVCGKTALEMSGKNSSGLVIFLVQFVGKVLKYCMGFGLINYKLVSHSCFISLLCSFWARVRVHCFCVCFLAGRLVRTLNLTALLALQFYKERQCIIQQKQLGFPSSFSARAVSSHWLIIAIAPQLQYRRFLGQFLFSYECM